MTTARPETHQNPIHLPKNFRPIRSGRLAAHPLARSRTGAEQRTPDLHRFSVKAASKDGGGGGDRNRTDDPLLAKQVLCQLSYTPSRQPPLAY